MPQPARPLATPPSGGPAIPVKLTSQDLYLIGRRFLAAQDECATIHDRLRQRMAENSKVVGADDSGTKFADAYTKAVDSALDGFVRAHRLLGAVGQGLALSAENHRAADAASTPPGSPTTEPFPSLAPHPPPAEGDVPPIGGATEWWVISPLDKVWPLCVPEKALGLAGAFQTASADFTGVIDKLHSDLRSLFAHNDSQDLQAAEQFWGRVTRGALLDGLPRLLSAIDTAITNYHHEVEGWKDRFRDALENGLTAAGVVAIGSLIADVLTEVGWAGLGAEGEAAAGAAAASVTPVAVAFAAAADAAANRAAIAAVSAFAMELGSTPEPGVETSDATKAADSFNRDPLPDQGSKLTDYFKDGRVPKASELEKYAEDQGWHKTQTPNGPPKYVDDNGVVRLTLKQGSPRAAGSESPHVEIRNEEGQRVDPNGNLVTRKSPGNHTPIDWDFGS